MNDHVASQVFLVNETLRAVWLMAHERSCLGSLVVVLCMFLEVAGSFERFPVLTSRMLAEQCAT